MDRFFHTQLRQSQGTAHMAATQNDSFVDLAPASAADMALIGVS